MIIRMSLLQPLNARLPIDVTESEILTKATKEHSDNAFPAIDVVSRALILPKQLLTVEHDPSPVARQIGPPS